MLQRRSYAGVSTVDPPEHSGQQALWKTLRLKIFGADALDERPELVDQLFRVLRFVGAVLGLFGWDDHPFGVEQGVLDVDRRPEPGSQRDPVRWPARHHVVAAA